MESPISYLLEVRERAVRLVFEQQKAHGSQCCGSIIAGYWSRLEIFRQRNLK